MTCGRTQFWTVTFWITLLHVAISSSACASADLQIGPLPDDVVTAIRLHDGASGDGRGITFGVPIAEGDVGTETQLVVTTAEGTVVPSQWNPLATWRTDGSVLHGAMTMITTGSGSNGGIYYVRPAQGESGQAISFADIAASGFDASVSVRHNGTVYSLSAADLLAGVVSARLNYTHFSGHIASEVVVGGPLLVDGSGAEHDTLQAYFYIRAYEKPVSHAYVTIVFENTGAFNTLSDLDLESVDVRVGNESLSDFPKSTFTAYADIRYPKRAWWRGSDSLWVQHDLEYVSSTELMPRYRPVVMDGATLQGYPQASEWNERRILSSSALEGGGAKPELAPFDSWTAAYMVSGDRRAWNAMRVALDEYSMMVLKLGSGVVHARDEQTGFPLDLTQKGVVGRIWYSSGGTDVLNATRGGNIVAQTDIAHWPAIGYLPYLLTAESNEMENVQHSAIQTWLNEAPGGHKGTIPGREVRWLQVRGMAWALREIINGAVVTPDHHPLRYALQTSASYALQEYSRSAQAADPNGNLGLLFVPSTIAIYYNEGTAVAPWMDDFLTWAVGSAYERGWKAELDESGFWSWKAQSVVGRFGTDSSTEYCWEQAAAYNLKVRSSISAPIYSDWNSIYRATFDASETCSAPGTSSISSDSNPTSYGAQISGALSVAASTGVDGATTAWDIYENRQIPWTSGFETRPEWAIVPRTDTFDRPLPPSDLNAN